MNYCSWPTQLRALFRALKKPQYGQYSQDIELPERGEGAVLDEGDLVPREAEGVEARQLDERPLLDLRQGVVLQVTARGKKAR